MTEIHDKIVAAFSALQRAGFLVRRNFECCDSCAGARLATHVGGMRAERRAKVRGVVYYTRQAQQAAYDHTGAFRGLYLAYGPVAVHGHGKVGLPAASVGPAVVAACVAAGLEVDWDGQAETKIKVVGHARGATREFQG